MQANVKFSYVCKGTFERLFIIVATSFQRGRTTEEDLGIEVGEGAKWDDGQNRKNLGAHKIFIIKSR